MILENFNSDWFITSLPLIMRYVLFISIGVILLSAACSYKPLETVQYVDVKKYSGKWYEIAHLPTSFQKGCQCTTAEYEVIDATTVRVKNRCKKKSEWDEAYGKAFVKDKQSNSKLAVQFQWPFRGKYWIIDLADDYSYAVVGHPNRKYLWILSRTPQMNKQTYDRIIAESRQKGFPVDKLIVTEHDCAQ